MSNLATMTYPIGKDEDDNECLFVTAIIRNKVVELDWIRAEDDATSSGSRVAAIVETLASPDTPLPPETAFLTMRLYRRGDVGVTLSVCADSFRDEAVRLGKQAAIDVYDAVFPATALEARTFVKESINEIKRQGAVDALESEAGEQGAQSDADQLLPYLLNKAKAELANTGTLTQQIGWLVNNSITLVEGAPPLEKYRYFRAAAEVAEKVGAQAIVQISDNYETNLTGERTGAEIIVVSWIKPDGSSVNAAAIYTRRKHPELDRDIITFSPDDALGTPNEGKQNLIPAWGSYQPN
jgi:hypothetical protein